jgi:hypothetical protein
MSLSDKYYAALFQDASFTPDDLKSIFIFFIAILLVIVFVAKRSIKGEKELSWAISLVNSFVASVVGVIYLGNKIPKYGLETFFTYQINPKEFFYTVDNICLLTCIWFALANITDLVFGLICYRAHLNVLTAYIHHTIYIYMMYNSVTGDGIFKSTPYASAFVYMVIEEIPTFLLALGSMFPSYRSDLGFGVTFFLLRICYHGYVFSFAIYSKAEGIVLFFYSITLLMHIFWFYTWFSKYGIRLLGLKKKTKGV